MHSSPHKIIILKHGGGELANQLWNYASIYAYGLEMGIPVKNPSFFEYHSFFRFLSHESMSTKSYAFFFKTFRRRSHPLNKIARIKYAFIARMKAIAHAQSLISSENNANKVIYLPPTDNPTLSLPRGNVLYFTGWLFRNPVGLKKFRNELIEAFRPNAVVEAKIDTILTPLRKKYEKVIGVHIRQADYRQFKDGKYIVESKRVREIIDEYIEKNSLDIEKTLFLITSDEPVDEGVFKGLNVFISKEHAVIDLFLLSKTDAILGSDSSYGAFASWYGNIPHIVFKNEPMDWEYYKDKRSFFENKYLQLLRY